MKKPDTIIAIDPDVAKSGVATLDTHTRSLELASLTFPQLIDYLTWAKEKAENRSLLVMVEASWNTRANWHLEAWEQKRRAAAKGYDVGRNHETGRKIIEICQHLGLTVREQPPLRKIWKGAGGKITHQELAAFTHIQGRTNQDTRDAALIAWSVAGLPIHKQRVSITCE